ncbi:MAG: hypothetical protein ACYS99_21020, partial [Planctomycetota bacterium]
MGADARAGGEAEEPTTAGEGERLVRGALALPEDASRAEVAILAQSGLLLLRSRAGAGPFEVPLPEHEAEDRPLRLLAEAPACRRVEVAIPDGGGYVGTLTLQTGPCYRGWLTDTYGGPVAGVIVILGSSVSLASRDDGGFLIPLDREYRPELVRYSQLWFQARGVYYGAVDADPSGLVDGHVVRMTEPGSAPRIRLVRLGTGEPLAGVRVALDPFYGGSVDRGRTDEEGRWDPLWPVRLRVAFLVVSDPGGKLRITLRRDDVHEAGRADVAVPKRDDSNHYRLRFVDRSGRQFADTELRLVIAGGREIVHLDVRTDAEGRVGFHLWFPEGGTVRLDRCGPIERLSRGRVTWVYESEPDCELSPPKEVEVRLDR